MCCFVFMLHVVAAACAHIAAEEAANNRAPRTQHVDTLEDWHDFSMHHFQPTHSPALHRIGMAFGFNILKQAQRQVASMDVTDPFAITIARASLAPNAESNIESWCACAWIYSTSGVT